MACICEKNNDEGCIHNYYITYEDGCTVHNYYGVCCSCDSISANCKCCCGSDNGNGNGNNGEGTGSDKGKIDITLLGNTGTDMFYGVLADGDTYVAYGDTAGHCLLARYDKKLNLLHKRGFKAPAGTSLIHDAQLLENGNIITAGYKSVNSRRYAQIIEFDTNLELVRQTSYVQSSGHAIFRRIMKVPSDFTGSACYIAAGYSGSADQTNNAMLAAFDENLNLLKQVRLDSSSHFYGIVAEKDRIVVAGLAKVAGGAGNYDGIIAEFDDTLTLQKTIRIGRTADDYLVDLVKVSDGYIAAGHSQSSGGNGWDTWLLSLDKDYTIRKSLFIGNKGNEQACRLRLDAQGHLLLTATTTSAGAGGSDILFMILNQDLTILNQLTFGGADAEAFADALATPDGSHILAGATASAGAGGTDAFIALLSGKWADLTGSVAKYPDKLYVNANPGITSTDNFAMTVNKNTVKSHAGVVVQALLGGESFDPSTLIVDANAVIEA